MTKKCVYVCLQMALEGKQFAVEGQSLRPTLADAQWKIPTIFGDINMDTANFNPTAASGGI